MTKKIPKNRQNEQYWLNREKQQQAYIDKNLASDEQYNKVIQAQYDSLLADINKRIDSELSKLANENGISIADMRAKVSQTDIKQFEAEAKRVVAQADKMRKQGKSPKLADWSQEVNDRLRLYNVTMRINRLEYLKAGIGLDMITAGLQVDSELRDKLLKDATEEQKRQAGILGENNAHIDTLAIGNIILAKTKSNNFSQRIWINMDVLQAKLSQTIMTGITTGQSYNEMARRLKTQVAKDVKNVTYATQRIARTEAARVQTEITMNSLKRNGYDFCKWYKEPSACHDCALIGNQDNGWGKGIYKVKDVPTIPVHPNCRCAVGAYWVDEEKYLLQNETTKITQKDLKNNLTVDRDLVNSKSFHDKFEELTLPKQVRETLYQVSMGMLEHRDGTNSEDLAAIDFKTGKCLFLNTSTTDESRVNPTPEEYKIIENNPNKVVLLHNHPKNGRPSWADIKTLQLGKAYVEKSIIVGHKGSVAEISLSKRNIDIIETFNKWYNNYVNEGYTKQESVLKATDRLYDEGAFNYVRK